MATLSMESQKVDTDVNPDEGVASGSDTRDENPQGKNDRFLTLFAAATVATLPAAILIGLGYYLNNREMVFAGVVLFIIATALWLVAYLTVAWWILSSVGHVIGKIIEFTIRPSAKRS